MTPRARDAGYQSPVGRPAQQSASIGFGPAWQTSGHRPLVTIMIPTYCQAHFVGTAISSALSQDYEPLEVVVIDDASPDSTDLAVQSFAGDPRFRYVRNSHNLGRVANYRRGLYEVAQGDYVLNLDGDDWLADPTYISSAIDALSANPEAVLVFATAGRFSEVTGVEDGPIPDPGPPVMYQGREILDLYARGRLGVAHLTALYSRAAAVRAEFYRYNIIGSDTLSILILAAQGPMVYIPRRVAYWRQHGQNASIEPDWRLALANLAIADVPPQRFIEAGVMSNREGSAWRAKVAALLARQQLGQYLSAGKFRSAASYLFGLLAMHPVAASLLVRPSVAIIARKIWNKT